MLLDVDSTTDWCSLGPAVGVISMARSGWSLLGAKSNRLLAVTVNEIIQAADRALNGC